MSMLQKKKKKLSDKFIKDPITYKKPIIHKYFIEKGIINT